MCILSGANVLSRCGIGMNDIRQILAIGNSPAHFLENLAKLCEIGYYEPLGSWSIKLG